jgi:hypothetical protein
MAVGASTSTHYLTTPSAAVPRQAGGESHGPDFDNTGRVASTSGVPMPVFWLGLLLIFFGVGRRRLPAGGSPNPGRRHGARLPTIALDAFMTGIVIRPPESRGDPTVPAFGLLVGGVREVTATQHVTAQGRREHAWT